MKVKESSVHPKNSPSKSASSRPSSKTESSSSSRSAVGSNLSLNKGCKATEHAKILEKELEEWLNQTGLLVKTFELEKQKLREQALIACEKANIEQFKLIAE